MAHPLHGATNTQHTLFISTKGRTRKGTGEENNRKCYKTRKEDDTNGLYEKGSF